MWKIIERGIKIDRIEQEGHVFFIPIWVKATSQFSNCTKYFATIISVHSAMSMDEIIYRYGDDKFNNTLFLDFLESLNTPKQLKLDFGVENGIV